MMYHDDGELLLREIPLLTLLTCEVIQQRHENLQLTAGVHNENGGETASGHSHRIHHERRQKLHRQH